MDRAPAGESPRRQNLVIFAAAGALALVALAAYANSLAVPFVFDDEGSICGNDTIRQLWPLTTVLCPRMHGETVGGRPLVNLSLALNYRFGGLNVWGYHAANLAIHVLVALLLFGVVRRTLRLPTLADRFGAASDLLAFLVALLWIIHPLGTEAVTYVVQRAESLGALFWLATLYAVIRGVGSRRASVWYAAAVVLCALGMASKEVVVSVPLVVLLYDRTFLAGSFKVALRRRWPLYVGLAVTWALLAVLVVTAGGRGGTAGFGLGITPWQYALTQCDAILRYLRLSFWPTGLCLDYGNSLATGVSEILPGAVVVALLSGITLWALIRWPPVGFLGVVFLAALAPTSSFVPVASQTIAEHRMYLPLAAVVTAVVLGSYWVWRQLGGYLPTRGLFRQLLWLGPTVAVAVVLATLTHQRNADYRDEFSIWLNTVDRAPNNARAHNNLAALMGNQGQIDEAIAHWERALRLLPNYAKAHYNLGNALIRCKRFDEAILHQQKALDLEPNYPEAHSDMAKAFAAQGKTDRAIFHWQEAIKLRPDYAEAYNNLGRASFERGQLDEAIAYCQKALAVTPDYAEAHYNLGGVFASRGELDQAIAQYEEALRIYPDFAEAHNNLAVMLAGRGRWDDAILHWRAAVKINTSDPQMRDNFARALAKRGKLAEAVAQWRAAVRLEPNSVPMLNQLAWTLATSSDDSIRNGTEAVELAARTVRLAGGQEPAVLDTLAAAYAEAGRFAEAVETAQRAQTLASAQGKTQLADALRSRIERYRASSPLREATPSPVK